jgi:glutamate dehydrogenase
MMANGYAGAEAVKARVEPRREEVARIRGAVDDIAASGLTISKVTVAASLLGDLARQ